MADVSFRHTLRLDRKPCFAVPVQTGVPFPVGVCHETKSIRLLAEDKQAPARIRTLMKWPDGSIQWVLVQWLARPGITSYQLASGMNPSESPPINIRANSEVGAKLQVVLSSGEQLDLDFSNDPDDCDDLRCFLSVDKASDSVLQHFRLTLRNPRAAVHPGGIWELGDPNSVRIKSATLSLTSSSVSPSANGQAKLSEWQSFQQSWRLEQFGSGGQNYESPIHRDAKGQVRVPFNGFRVARDGEQTAGNRATPSLVVGDEDSAIGFFCERFWQNFPLALASQSQGIQVELFPSDFGEQELQPGEQKTYEFWIGLGPCKEVSSALDQLRDLPKVILDPEKVSESNVIPHLSPRDTDKNAGYLQLIDQAIDADDSYFAKREVIDMYGWRNFGEVWGDHEAVYSTDQLFVSHYNNQYDVVLGLGIHALQGADGRYRELMHDLARHVIDIDIYHTTQDCPAYNHGQFWHTVHYMDAGLSTHRTYPKGSCGGGPSSGQAYSRGLLLHYCLTGDETAREAVMNMGDWMIAAEDASKTKYRWLAGGETGLTSASGTESYHGPGRGPANAVEILVTAYQLSHERKYLRQAERIIRRVVHPSQNLAKLNLLDAENRWFYTMFLQSLGRYLDVKLSFDELDEAYSYGQQVLLLYADWMVENEYPYLDKPEILEYPNETWSGQEMRKCEALQWAAKHAVGERRAGFLEKADFFFDTACEQLLKSPRKSLCRPVALLLSNGYSRSWFQSNGDTLESMPQGEHTEFEQPKNFVGQKQRAIGRAKAILVSGCAAAVLFGGIAIMLLLRGSS